MKTFLVISNASVLGGAEVSLLNLIECVLLYPDVDRVVLYAGNIEHINSVERLKSEKVFVIKPSCKIKTYPKFIRYFFEAVLGVCDLIKIANKYSPDYILCNVYKGALYLWFANFFCSLTGLVIYYVRDYSWHLIQLVGCGIKRKKYLVPSKAVMERYIALRDQAVVLGNIADITDMGGMSEVNNKFSQGFDLKVLCLGMIVPRKGYEYIIRAVVMMNKRGRRVQLKIVGRAVDERYCESLIHEIETSDFSNFLHIVPHSTEVSSYYKECDVVAVPSISEYDGPETFGRTIIEAWSFKKPVVAFSCGGPKYLIKNGWDGRLVKEKDINGLTDALDFFARNKSYISLYGERGYSKVKSKYSRQFICNEFKKLLKKGC